jgi:cold shock CspA family protein
MRGTVTAFDERVGLGVVTGDDGAEWPFHAIAVADGRRTIAVGTRVDFEVVAGLLGRWEAASIERAVDPSRKGE